MIGFERYNEKKKNTRKEMGKYVFSKEYFQGVV